MTLSVIVPCYNEEANIKATLEELLSTIKKTPGVDKYQIIVVDDHSPDDTFQAVKSMKNEGISCIRLAKRMGSHIAIRAGLKEATGEATVFLPADAQEDPGILDAMIKRWQNGSKVVWGLSKAKSHKGWHIRKSAELFYKILKWSGATRDAVVDISRATFFFLDSSVVSLVNQCSLPNAPLHGLVICSGPEQSWIEYKRRPRKSGKSKWSFLSLLGLAKDWIIEFSDSPVAAFLRTSRRTLEGRRKKPLFDIEQRT